MSDVPLGAMLSGGLDSSLIVALMARHMTEPLETFAVGFAGEDSELPDARRVADALGANHHELEVELQSDPEYLRAADLAPRRAARRPLLDRLPGALRARRRARDGGALRPGRRRALRRLPQAPRRLAGRDLGPRARRAARRRPRRCCAAGPGRAGRLARRAAGRRSGRAPAGLERLRARRPAAASCSAARWPSTPAPPSASSRGTLAGAPGVGAARGRALHGRAARPGRRHAHLLRPRLDGVLARGARAVPRPRAGRALRHDPDQSTRCTACRASTSCAWPPRATCRTSC